MNWWDQQIIIDKESCQKVALHESGNVKHNSKLPVALPDAPLKEWQLFAFGIVAMPEVVFYHTKSVNDPETESDCWCVRQQHIMKDMIPPTLSEMWQNMLPTQLNYFVH